MAMNTNMKHGNNSFFHIDGATIIGNGNKIYGNDLTILGNGNKIYGSYLKIHGNGNRVCTPKKHSVTMEGNGNKIDDEIEDLLSYKDPSLTMPNRIKIPSFAEHSFEIPNKINIPDFDVYQFETPNQIKKLVPEEHSFNIPSFSMPSFSMPLFFQPTQSGQVNDAIPLDNTHLKFGSPRREAFPVDVTRLNLRSGSQSISSQPIPSQSIPSQPISSQPISSQPDPIQLPITEIKYPSEDDTKNDIETSEERDQCIICLTNKKRCVALPCGHIDCCISCSRDVAMKPDPTCPQCRTKLMEMKITYS
jgi:hypothetical protein